MLIFSNMIPKESFYQNPTVYLMFDFSSVSPRFEIITETYQEKITKDKIPELPIELDIVFRLPPKKSYNININVKRYRKKCIKIC